MIRIRSRFTKLKSDNSGAALMMALFTIVMLWIFATEIMYETNVEFAVSAQAVNQVRAHYAAKAGVDISLLRLHIYRKVIATMGDMAKTLPILDMIWQMPFAWPPLVPAETNSVEKDSIKDTVKKSLMQGNYLATIESESSKIDLSLLATDNPELIKLTVEQLNQLFQSQVQNDEAFARRHNGEDFTKLVNNIKDWVDSDEKSDNGGDEKSLYSNLGDGTQYPPNQLFKTIQELHLVAGMTDELYNLLVPRVTIYGAAAINVKYASKEVLGAAFGLNEDQSNRLIEERNKSDTAILKDATSFFNFLESLGVRHENLVDSQTNKPKINILVEPEFNFRIKSIGSSGKVQREITAIVYDYDRVLDQLRSYQPKPTPTPTPPQQTTNPANPQVATPTPSPAPSPTPRMPPNEAPSIVYWNET